MSNLSKETFNYDDIEINDEEFVEVEEERDFKDEYDVIRSLIIVIDIKLEDLELTFNKYDYVFIKKSIYECMIRILKLESFMFNKNTCDMLINKYKEKIDNMYDNIDEIVVNDKSIDKLFRIHSNNHLFINALININNASDNINKNTNQLKL